MLQFAENRAQNPDDRVALKCNDITGATGVSRRYAYDLIDELPERYECFNDRSDIGQYGDLEISRETQDRALVVDLEVVHTDGRGVNKFTTRTTENGGEK